MHRGAGDTISNLGASEETAAFALWPSMCTCCRAGQGQPVARTAQYLGTATHGALGAKGGALHGPQDRLCRVPRSIGAGTQGKEMAESEVPAPLP